jgi:FkbM family methyltransferase
MVSLATPRPVPVRAVARSVLRACLKRAVQRPAGLAAVNRLHRALTTAQKRRFFYLCVDEICPVEGRWRVDFAGRSVWLPLHREFHLAWAAATGFHGYDTEVHTLYEALVLGSHPPRVFFDVGANYGLHSLKLLAHGVRVVSFEPNTACHDVFLESCLLNGLRPDVRAVAAGGAAGRAMLAVPDGRTYLGTIAADVIEGWGDAVDVTTHEVERVTLDAVTATEGLVPDLVKIDTEGSELDVLQGADAVLQEARPLIVLESWRASAQRAVLFQLLAAYRYRLHALRVGAGPSPTLGASEFLASPATNFVARPIP